MKLSLVDHLFFSMETRECPMHISGLMIFKPPEDYDGNFMGDLVAQLRNQHKVTPPFNLVYHKPLWRLGCSKYIRDSKFDLDYHLRHIALPKPGTMEQLDTLAARLHGHMLDRNRPLWECYLIEGLEGGRFAIYLKFHHAQFDGKAALRTVYSAFSEDPDDRTVRPFWQIEGRQWEKDRSDGNLWEQLETIPLKCGQQVKNISELSRYWFKVGILGNLFNEEMVPFPFDAPQTMFNRNITGQRIFSRASTPLDEVKRLGKKTESTVNDVALAICSGALRRYLLDRQQLPERPLIGFVPVSLPPKKGAGANRTTGIQCNLGTDIDDPMKRLNYIKASMKRNKQLAGQLSDEAFQNLPLSSQFPWMITSYLKLADQIPVHPYNVVISNVPGSRKAHYLYGARLEANYPLSALGHGSGLNITLSSHENKMDFGILSCRSLMPDLDKFSNYMNESFTEYMEAVFGREKARKQKPKETKSKPAS